jgi:hypothetical protein
MPLVSGMLNRQLKAPSVAKHATQASSNRYDPRPRKDTGVSSRRSATTP